MEKDTIADFIEILQNELDELAHGLIVAKDEDLYDEDAWQPPSKEIETKFPDWRARSFNAEKLVYKHRYHENPIPGSLNLNQEIERLGQELSLMYKTQDNDLSKGLILDAYYCLAQMVGKIDYLKWLYSNKENNPSLTNYVQKVFSRQKKKIETPQVDPLTFIYPELQQMFVNAEKEAGITSKSTKIRIAAFLELAIKWFTPSAKAKVDKKRRETLNTFSVNRYNREIRASLNGTNKVRREKIKETYFKNIFKK
jgi:hypothetical protein